MRVRLLIILRWMRIVRFILLILWIIVLWIIHNKILKVLIRLQSIMLKVKIVCVLIVFCKNLAWVTPNNKSLKWTQPRLLITEKRSKPWWEIRILNQRIWNWCLNLAKTEFKVRNWLILRKEMMINSKPLMWM